MCGKIVVMARDPERTRNTAENTGNEQGAAARAPKEDKSWSGVDGFLREIKLMMLMRQKSPGSEEYVKLRDIEKNLSAADAETREKAKTAADELIAVFEGVKGEAERSTLETVVDRAYGDMGERSDSARDLARQIDQAKKAVDAKAETPQGVSSAELEALSHQLVEFKNRVGFQAMTEEGMQMVEETMLKVVHLRDVRRYTENPLAYQAPLKAKTEYFAEGSSDDPNDKRLKVRTGWGGEEGQKFAEKLERVKKNVREVVIEQSRELSDQESIQSLQDVSELRAQLKHLVGKEHKRALDTLETLTAAESHFQRILEQKIGEKLKAARLNVDQLAVDAAVGDVLAEARGGRFAGGRARYEFQDAFDKLTEKVAIKAKKFDRQIPKLQEHVARDSDYSPQSMVDKMIAQQELKRQVDFLEKVDSIKPVLAEMGIDYRSDSAEFEKWLRAGTEKERVAKIEDIVGQARERGMSASRLKMGELFLRSLLKDRIILEDGTEVRTNFVDVKERLSGYVKNHQYGRYIREMKAYVSKVGLRESSADFQFAIMLRDAKEVIADLEPDIAEEFDSWQQSLFIPPFKAVDPETFRQMFERVWNAGNLDHVLNPAYANAAAMLVEVNGDKKVMSTAVFYQLLQRGDNATRFLDAPKNGTDSTSFRIWIDYLYGKGAIWEGDLDTGVIKSADGRVLAKMTDSLRIQGYDVASKSLDGGDFDTFTLRELLEQSQWMHRYAENFFMYSGEAGKHMRHYPKEDMENANKWLFSQDQMFEGYGGHFGKYAAPFWQIAKLGHLLREIRTYKDSGILLAAMTEEMTGAGVGGKRAREFAEMWTNKLRQKIAVDGKSFKVGLLSIEEIRLIGNEFGSAEEAWVHAKDYLMAHNMPEGMIKDQNFIREVLARKARGDRLSEEEENWAKQAEEFYLLCKNLQWSDEKKKEYGGMSEREMANSMTKEELAIFAARKNTIFGGNWQPANMREFIAGFEYAAVMDPAKYQQGTDPIEFARKYAKLSEEVAKILPKIHQGIATAPDFIEVQKALRAYLTPEEVDQFIEIMVRKSIQSRTNQLIPYEIAKLGKDGRTIDYRYMEGEDKHRFYFIDRDGHRIAKTENFRGNYMFKRWKVKPMRPSDVEVLMDAMHGEAMIPRDIGDDMLDDLVGGGRVIDNILERVGLKEKGKPLEKGSRGLLIKRIFARTKRLIQRLPLFDDPVWAMFSLSAAILNFAGEAAKEVAKSAEK